LKDGEKKNWSIIILGTDPNKKKEGGGHKGKDAACDEEDT